MEFEVSNNVRQNVRQYLNSHPDRTKNILTEIRGNRFYVTFNRPARKNAFTSDMWLYFTQLLNEANQLSQVKYIIVSGAGGNFTSGNDLSNFSNAKLYSFGTQRQLAVEQGDHLKENVQALIKSAKPIFAIVQGKAIGFAFTQLALYDRVFATKNSEFNAPLVRSGQGPEMCSSYTFPKIFGRKMAEELIIKNRQVDAAFLEKYDFLTCCNTRKDAEEALDLHLKQLDVLDWESYVNARALQRNQERSLLLRANEEEVKNIVERWASPNLVPYLKNYMDSLKKSKL